MTHPALADWLASLGISTNPIEADFLVLVLPDSDGQKAPTLVAKVRGRWESDESVVREAWETRRPEPWPTQHSLTAFAADLDATNAAQQSQHEADMAELRELAKTEVVARLLLKSLGG